MKITALIAGIAASPYKMMSFLECNELQQNGNQMPNYCQWFIKPPSYNRLPFFTLEGLVTYGMIQEQEQQIPLWAEMDAFPNKKGFSDYFPAY